MFKNIIKFSTLLLSAYLSPNPEVGVNSIDGQEAAVTPLELVSEQGSTTILHIKLGYSIRFLKLQPGLHEAKKLAGEEVAYRFGFYEKLGEKLVSRSFKGRFDLRALKLIECAIAAEKSLSDEQTNFDFLRKYCGLRDQFNYYLMDIGIANHALIQGPKLYEKRADIVEKIAKLASKFVLKDLQILCKENFIYIGNLVFSGSNFLDVPKRISVEEAASLHVLDCSDPKLDWKISFSEPAPLKLGLISACKVYFELAKTTKKLYQICESFSEKMESKVAEIKKALQYSIYKMGVTDQYDIEYKAGSLSDKLLEFYKSSHVDMNSCSTDLYHFMLAELKLNHDYDPYAARDYLLEVAYMPTIVES